MELDPVDRKSRTFLEVGVQLGFAAGSEQGQVVVEDRRGTGVIGVRRQLDEHRHGDDDEVDGDELDKTDLLVRDRVQDLINDGKTLAQVKASNPTLGYRSQYGADSGPWTTDMFVEAIYNELAAKKGKK